MAGINSTFVLTPDGGTAIAFDMAVTTGVISGYVVPSGSIRFHEADRLSVKYAEGAKTDGGKVSNARGPLAKLEFDVIVSDTTRAGMIAKSDALFAAVTNATGGTLQYKPDGVGASVMTTYFAYLQSAPPEVVQERGNRWDGNIKTRKSGTSTYSMVFSVVLMTAPFAASDPATPVQLVNAQTVDNAYDSTPRTNYITIAAATVKGGEPALIRIKAAPQDGTLSRLIVTRRTTGLAAFQAMYTAPTALAPTAAWTQVNDATRCGGTYWQCSPSQSDAWYGLRYTIANWTSHRGTAAIACIYRANGEGGTDAWDMKAAWSIANTPLEGRAQTHDSLKEWRFKLLAEMDIPDAAMSDVEDMTLNIDVYVRRTAGIGTISIDAIMLLFTDEAVIDAQTPTDAYCDTDETALIENLDDELAHIVTTSDSKLQYICNLIGTPGLIPLEPGIDNRLDFLWERAAVLFTDDFSGYGANWRGIEDFEPGGSWDFSSYPYERFCAVNWRAASTYDTYGFGYPVEITGGGLDTATLVSAGKMRSDGNDLRVTVDGQEVMRWLYGMNGASTKVWANLHFSQAVTLTISADIASSGEIASITFNQAINVLPEMSSSKRIIMIGSELFTYTAMSQNLLGRTIYGVKRAAFQSSAAAHTAGDAAYWIQNDVRIMYGNAQADPPAIAAEDNYYPDDFKPAFSLNSTNTSWVYEEFGNDGQTRTGGWNRTRGMSACKYGGDHHTNADPWVELGIYTDGRYYSGIWNRRYMCNVCRITNVNFTNGEMYRSQSGTIWDGKIQSSLDDVTWTDEYTITQPTTPDAWEVWSRSEALTAGSQYVGLRLGISGPGYGFIEAADCTVTLDGTYTPACTVQSEDADDMTTYAVEGGRCQPLTATSSDATTLILEPPAAWPFSPGFIDFYMHLSTGASVSGQSIRIRLKTSESDYYELTISKSQGASAEGDYFETHALSSFSTTGTPDLNALISIEFMLSSIGGTTTFYLDDVRLSAPDPNNAAACNDTGAIWDFYGGSWHVEEQESSALSLGNSDNEAGVEKVALIAANYGADIQYNALVRAKRADGDVGLVFRASDTTVGSEDMYALMLSTGSNKALLYQYTAGASTELGDGVFECAYDTDYKLGVEITGSDIQCFAAEADGDLWGNRVIQVTDATHATGKAGLISIGALARFTDVRLQGIGDRHNPADRLTVSIWGVFRTITPFHQ